MPIKRNRILLPLLITAFTVTTIIQGCSTKKNKESQAANNSVSVPIFQVRKSALTIENEYAARLQGSNVVEIRPQTNGYITNIFVKEGSYVHTGQKLVEIDKRIYQAELNAAIQNKNAAESKVKAAQIELDKLQTLVKNNVVSKIQLETAKTQYQQAIAALKEAETKIATAQTNLDYSLIKAPRSGFIGLISKRIGSLAKTTDIDPITVLTSINTMYAYFSMSEIEFHNLYSKLPGSSLESKTKNISNVYLKLPNGTVYPQPGKIAIVTKQIDSSTGSITLRADFPNNNNILLSGGTAKVILRQTIGDAITIPIKATLDIQDKVFVYVLDQANKVQQREINISYRYNNLYIISAGLKEGDKIVAEGLNKVSVGTTILNSKY